MTTAGDELWRLVSELCPPGPPPCAAIARRTGLADATVSDWFRKRYVPPWPRFQLFLRYFSERHHEQLTRAWQAARDAERAERPAGRSAAIGEHHRRSAAPRLIQLPHDIVDFTGRVDVVERVTELLSRGAGQGLTIVALHGMAGAGKTRLAVHALRRGGAAVGDVLLYVDLAGNAPGRDPVAPVEALGSLLRLLGVPDSRIPPDLAGRVASYRDRLERERVVVMLDDAADAAQVGPLLPGGAGCRVLITSRRSLSGLDSCVPVSLDSFTQDEALTLLTRVVGGDRVAAEPAAVQTLLHLTGGLPLAVSLVARRLRSRPSWRVSDLVERLESEDTRLTELAADHIAVRAAFATSYEQLDVEEKLVFRRLAALPGRDFDPCVVAAVTGLTTLRSSTVLEHLVDENLVLSPGPGRYTLHDLLALFAAEMWEQEDDHTTRSTSIRVGLEWYLRSAVVAAQLVGPDGRRVSMSATTMPVISLSSPAEANNWYDLERANLNAVQAGALARGHEDIAWKLPVTLFGFCRSRQSWAQFDQVLREALAAAWRIGDQAGVAWAQISLGIGDAMLGRRSDSMTRFAEAADVYRRLGDTEGEGVALNNMGEILRLTGDLAAAIELYRKDLALARDRSDEIAMASSLTNIGKTELARRDPLQAERTLREALRHARRANDQHAVAEVLHELGRCDLAHERVSGATEHFRRAALQYEDIGDLAAAVDVLTDLADAQRSTTPLQTARALLPRIDEPFAAGLEERIARLESAIDVA